MYYLKSSSFSRLDRLDKSKAYYQLPPLIGYSPTAIAIATLGQRNLYDDFISIWLTIELQSPHTKDDIRYLDPYIMSILSLKPKVPSAYSLSCYTMLSLGDARKCIKYLDISKEIFPEDWKNPFLEGFISLFILSEPENASRYFKEAEQLDKAPKYIGSIRKKLDEKMKYSI